MKLKKIDLSPRIGTEIRLDIDMLLSGESAAEIRETLQQRGVIVFRKLGLTDSQQLAFAHTIGKVSDTEAKEGIMKVALDRESSPTADYLRGTIYWHMDGTHLNYPNFAGMMTARRLSATGGETEFANTYAAYDDLPTARKSTLDSLRVTHSFAQSQKTVFPVPTLVQLRDWHKNHPEKTHALVWTHRSGRKSLVLGSTAVHVQGMDIHASDELLIELLEWSTQPQYVYHHKWEVGDLVVWDNTGTLHRVCPYALDSGRLMHRTTLVGEEAFT